MKNLLFTFAFCFLFIGNVFGQNEENRKWLLEIGGTKSYMNSDVTILNTNETYRAKLNYGGILPSIRLIRNIQLPKKNLSMKPFLGFATIGMSRGTMAKTTFEIDASTYFFSVSSAIVRMRYLEIGNFLSYNIKNFDIQFGLKGQYLLNYQNDITLDYAPQQVRLIPMPSPDSDELESANKNLTNFSANAGLRGQYRWKRFTIAAEYWQGITDLSRAKTDWFENKVYENNFRLMFGYNL